MRINLLFVVVALVVLPAIADAQQRKSTVGQVSDGTCKCKTTCNSGATPRGFPAGLSKAQCRAECDIRFSGCKAGNIRDR
jgi:hypothetical protein